MSKEGGSSGSLLWMLCIALLVITTTVGIWHSVRMASFKTNRSRTPEQLTVPAVKFVGEQDGPPERDLKARLIKLFRDKPSIDRAYLARTNYGDSTVIEITLCVVSSTGTDKALVSKVSDIFRDMFGEHEHLDILFIRDDQEQQVRAVCLPFYSRNS